MTRSLLNLCTPGIFLALFCGSLPCQTNWCNLLQVDEGVWFQQYMPISTSSIPFISSWYVHTRPMLYSPGHFLCLVVITIDHQHFVGIKCHSILDANALHCYRIMVLHTRSAVCKELAHLTLLFLKTATGRDAIFYYLKTIDDNKWCRGLNVQECWPIVLQVCMEFNIGRGYTKRTRNHVHSAYFNRHAMPTFRRMQSILIGSGNEKVGVYVCHLWECAFECVHT